MLCDAAGHNPFVMAEVGVDIDGDAVKADPAAHTDADGGDLVLAEAAIDPDTDPAVAFLSLDLILGQNIDHPVFKVLHKCPDIRIALL